MNYEKAYKEALERARKLYDSSEYVCEMDSYANIFPELRESVDDKIRKSILELVKQSSAILSPMNQKSMIAWLEKQGEKKTADKFEQNCYHNDGLYYAREILVKTFGKVEGYQSDDGKMEHQIAIETVNALYHKKTAEWSEEDEKMVEDIIEAIDTQYAVSDYNEMVSWLKSIKPQKHWKPSEEQINELRKVAFQFGNSCLSPYSDENKELVSLYNDIKKL